jgi:hypothetical protein
VQASTAEGSEATNDGAQPESTTSQMDESPETEAQDEGAESVVAAS